MQSPVARRFEIIVDCTVLVFSRAMTMFDRVSIVPSRWWMLAVIMSQTVAASAGTVCGSSFITALFFVVRDVVIVYL